MAVTEGDVARMRSQLSSIQAENSQYEREIAAMCNSIRNTYNYVTQANNDVVGALGNGETVLNNGDNTLNGVDAVREDIKNKVILYKKIETAYKNIRQLNNELRYQQGSEKIVKNILIAILDNEEKSLVSEETLTVQAEKAYLDKTAQSFFLTYIMRDIELRKHGKKEAADRARAKALEMDPRNSVWVYFMVALKRNDEKEQSFWLDKLVSRPLTGNEKANLKMLTMLTLRDNGTISKKISKYIGIDKLGEIDNSNIAASILASYRGAMTVAAPTYKYITKHISESEDLHESLRGAMNNESVAAFIQQVSTSKDEKMRSSIISKMLDTIVESCNSPEASKILKEIEKNQHVIDAKGVEADATAMDLKQEIEEVSDIKLEDCLYEWLTETEHYNGKKEISDFAYGKLKPCYKRAYNNYVGDYRRKNRPQLTLNIGDYSTKSALTSAAEEAVKIETHCKKRCEAEKAAIKDTKFILFTVFGAILLIAGFILNFIPQLGSIGSTAAFFIGIIGGCALLIMGVITKYKNYQAKIAADQKCKKDIVDYTEIMQLVLSDLESFREMFRTYDKKALGDSFF